MILTSTPTSRHQKPGSLPPHPNLPQYYGDNNHKLDFITKIFDYSAADYERINRVLSFGSGLWHRRRALIAAGLAEGMRALDIACGTGTTTRLASNIVGPTGYVIGLDPSAGMLREAQRNGCARLVMGIAECLPFEKSAFDFVSMAYALRHVSDLHTAFKEKIDVLKPGGRLLLLELARPTSIVQLRLARYYLKSIVPWLIRLTSGNKEVKTLMEYYWDTIESCVSPPIVVKALEDAGFQEVAMKRAIGGLVVDYLAIKPLTAAVHNVSAEYFVD